MIYNLFFFVLFFVTLIVAQPNNKMLFDKSMSNLEEAIYFTNKKHALYSFNIANISTPGFEPILYPEDQRELQQMSPDSQYSGKVLLEHMSTSLARNRNYNSAYISIYKKRLDTYRQIATMGKR